MQPPEGIVEVPSLARSRDEKISIVALTVDEAEVGRVMQICNACRYCEGFCAVFQAMTRRLEFARADINYLANLCHNCGSCLHACQYAPPHEFELNVPRAMAKVRRATYAEFAWPRPLAVLYKHNGFTLALALALVLTLFFSLVSATHGALWGPTDGSFYAVLPHSLLVWLFSPVFLFAVAALGIGVSRFWRQEVPGPMSGEAVSEATRNVVTLKYLDGGHGEGCNDADDSFSQTRRFFHHLTFYGFLLCFAATSVAAIYHYIFGWPAPYPFISIPKLLGTVGGTGLVIGTGGLFWLNLRRHPLHQAQDQRAMDRAFIALLFLTAASGLVLMLVRQSAALPLALCMHLGSVMALFALLPYSKFAHGVYRGAALLRWSIERRQPNSLQLGED